MSTAPIPKPLASHSISNVFSKFGKTNNGASVSFLFSSSKACCCALPQTKGTFFFVSSFKGQVVSSFKGQAMVLKSLTKRRYNLARHESFLLDQHLLVSPNHK